MKNTIREGAKIRIKKPKINNIGKDIANIGKDVGKAAEDVGKAAAEEARKQAERIAEEARRLAEQLAIENALKQLIEPLAKFANSATNSLKFLKDF